MPARFELNPAYLDYLARSEPVKVLLETVTAAAYEEAKRLAGGHKRIEDALGHQVVNDPAGFGWEGTVFLAGQWGFIARFREFGTVRQAAQPFLRPGVETAIHAFGGRFKAKGRGK